MRTIYVIAVTSALSIAALSQAQWVDKRQLGQGGEPKIVTDGKGHVYATCHSPCQFWVSNDYGAAFGEPKTFPDSFCDVDVIAQPNGQVNLIYIRNGVSGLTPFWSADFGKTINQGKTIEGSLDREWLAFNPLNNEVYVDYSNGYIGGPKSKGVYLSASTDGGKTFAERGRVDNEPENSYAVDPYLVTSTDGRIYGMWAASTDYNTIDKFRLSVSTDGGKTFKNHQTIGEMHKTLGDTQERWMLGSITAIGKSSVVVVYPDYTELTVDGKSSRPLLLYYKISTDGGQSFSSAKTVLSPAEIESCIRSFEKGKKGDQNVPYFAQTLPWLCTDPFGRVHIAFQDNRDGQALSNNQPMGLWHVRFASREAVGKPFAPSERVSENVACFRPPLDFLSVCADDKRAYVIWIETPNAAGWNFSGNVMFGRKILPSPKKDQID